MTGVFRRNPEFTRLWSAQVISQIGDWLQRVGVLTLIGQLGGESRVAWMGVGLFYAAEIAIRFLPSTVLGSLVGPLADRLPRRRLMIATDFIRAGLVLTLLLVDTPGELPLLYAVLFLQMATALLFESARTASMPNTLRAEDLHLGIAIGSATWSVALSIGALLGAGGVIVLGIQGVFLLDAATYLVSAAILTRLKLPPTPKHDEPLRWRSLFAYTDLRKGYAHAREVGALPAIFAKASWGSAGGFIVLLSLAGHEAGGGDEVFVAKAIGIAFALRGFGTAIGPFLARRFVGGSDRALRHQILLAYVLGAAGYVAFGLSGGYGLGLGFIVIAHMGGSILWVGSSTLWQRKVDDAYRGRAHTLEMTALMACASFGAILTGLVYDLTSDFLTACLATSALVLFGGLVWWASSRFSTEARVPTPVDPAVFTEPEDMPASTDERRLTPMK